MVGSRVRVRDGSCQTWTGRGFRTNVRSAALCDGQATGECSSPRDPGSRVAPSNSRRDPRASSRRGCGQQLAAPQPYRPGQPEISGRDTFATAGRPPSKRLPCGVRVLVNRGLVPARSVDVQSSRQPTGSVRHMSPWCGRRPLPLPTTSKNSRGDVSSTTRESFLREQGSRARQCGACGFFIRKLGIRSERMAVT